jgi:hypothetical protein
MLHLTFCTTGHPPKTWPSCTLINWIYHHQQTNHIKAVWVWPHNMLTHMMTFPRGSKNWTSPKHNQIKSSWTACNIITSKPNTSIKGMGMISQRPNPHDNIPDNLCPLQHSVLEKCIPVMYPLALLASYVSWFPRYKIKISTCTHLLLLLRLHCAWYFPLLLLCLVYTLSVVC